jgi:hypothetical protein
MSFADVDAISPWALNYVSDTYYAGFLSNYTGYLKPQDKLTRKEAALILSNVFEADKKFETLDIKSIFSDLSELNSTEVEAVKNVYTHGLMSGKYTGEFHPNDYLTRAEAAAIMEKLSNKLEN